MRFETDASLLGSVPVATFITRGRLRLDEHSLTFTPWQSSTAPIVHGDLNEFHSPARAATGLQIWHADKRLRFSFDRTGSDLAGQWVERLTPVVGEAPPGVRVRAPWPAWAWMAGLVGAMFVLTLVVVTLVRLLQ